MFTLHLKAIQYRSYSRRRRDQITRHIRIAFRRGSRAGRRDGSSPMNALWHHHRYHTRFLSILFSAVTVMDEGKLRSYRTIGKLADFFFSYPRSNDGWKEIFPSLINPNLSLSKNIYMCYKYKKKKEWKSNSNFELTWMYTTHIYVGCSSGSKEMCTIPFSLISWLPI